MRRKRVILEAYRDFASAFGTAWLMVIMLAFLTGGRIGRWGALILPIQIGASLVYSLLHQRRRRFESVPNEAPEIAGPRYFPI